MRYYLQLPLYTFSRLGSAALISTLTPQQQAVLLIQAYETQEPQILSSLPQALYNSSMKTLVTQLT